MVHERRTKIKTKSRKLIKTRDKRQETARALMKRPQYSAVGTNAEEKMYKKKRKLPELRMLSKLTFRVFAQTRRY